MSGPRGEGGVVGSGGSGGSGGWAGSGADDVMVDARGLRCPAPVIRLARAARGLAPGAVVTVRWTDPAARYDIPAWARMRGHEVLDTTPLEPPEHDAEAAGTPAWATRVRLGEAPRT